MDWSGLLNIGRRIATLTFGFNLLLGIFYFLFSFGLPPDHPLMKSLDMVGYLDYLKKLEQYKMVAVSEEVSTFGAILHNTAAALGFLSNLGALFLFGAAFILYRVLTLIPGVGVYIAQALYPIFGLFGVAGAVHFILCVVLKRC